MEYGQPRPLIRQPHINQSLRGVARMIRVLCDAPPLLSTFRPCDVRFARAMRARIPRRPAERCTMCCAWRSSLYCLHAGLPAIRLCERRLFAL